MTKRILFLSCEYFGFLGSRIYVLFILERHQIDVYWFYFSNFKKECLYPCLFHHLSCFCSKQYLEIQKNRGQFRIFLKIQCLISCIKFQHLEFYILWATVSPNTNSVSLLAKYFWHQNCQSWNFQVLAISLLVFKMKYSQ